MNNIKKGILAARKKGQLLLIEHWIKLYDQEHEEYAACVRNLDRAL